MATNTAGGVTSESRWARGPEKKDLLFQRPKRETAEAGTEKQREKGLLARKDWGSRGPDSRQTQGLAPSGCSSPVSPHCDKGVKRLLRGCGGAWAQGEPQGGAGRSRSHRRLRPKETPAPSCFVE